jgi:hypothetical protein
MAIDLGIIQQGINNVNALPGQMRALPAQHAEMRQEVAHAQKHEREIAGYKLLNEATKKHTIVNADGTKTINYGALAPELASQGYPDLAAQVTDAYLKSSGSALEFQNKANQSFAGYLNALPPERREEGARRAIPSYRNHFGANIDPLNYFDEDGTFNHDKANSFIAANQIGTLPAAEQAGIKSTEASTAETVARTTTGQYEASTTAAERDPGSSISKQVQEEARGYHLPPEVYQGKSAAYIQNNQTFKTAREKSLDSRYITPEEGKQQRDVVSTEGTKLEAISHAISAIKELVGTVRASPTIFKNFNQEQWQRFWNDEKYLGGKQVLDVLAEQHGVTLDLTTGPEAVLTALESLAATTEANVKRAQKRSTAETTNQVPPPNNPNKKEPTPVATPKKRFEDKDGIFYRP